MRTVLFVLLLLALLLLLAILILVIMDRVEEHDLQYQPTYYAALSQAGAAEGRVLPLGISPRSPAHFLITGLETTDFWA